MALLCLWTELVMILCRFIEQTWHPALVTRWLAGHASFADTPASQPLHPGLLLSVAFKGADLSPANVL